ncbi:glutathione S-transferase family protein [Motiliproteus coralliicola]|uniref:Glutathione S-transferase family protein n=1 Tax=Motiliproteus coralliicola TaxID=2283196 RepID=A0A369WN16_9GAMM|nr:glutathione S-transferase family protein [Motiliproteus coralliicola]RDE22891.1 glutathione S-transferase family protein [Motiliproteus coralliicola]
MYQLYYLPGACSLATQVVLHQLDQSVEIIDKQQVSDFSAINPTGMVPVLVDNGHTLREGAAVMLYLLDKHPNSMLPASGPAREQAIQDIMFANATMHPAYGRLFFIAQHLADERAKEAAFAAAAEAINGLWQVVEQQLATKNYLGGDHPSAADIMLTVYSRWGASFPVDIPLGPKTQNMVDAVQAMPSFQRAVAAEQQQSAA